MQIKQLLINQLQIAYSQMNDNNNATINQTASRFREQIQILTIKNSFRNITHFISQTIK